MKKRLTAAIMALVMLLSFTGCSGSKQEKIEISMYLWDKSMSKQLTPWLEKQFPDIDFNFVVGYNTMAYYSDLNDRGALPDIITCRRFSLNDAAHLADELMDLGQTEVVGSFYESYIENNREPDGAIRWLPMCAEVDGYIVNLDLFNEYDIPVPTNYEEFAYACRRFEEKGITPFLTDYNADYSCLEVMQGSAIPELMSLEGTMWRKTYESETQDGSNPIRHKNVIPVTSGMEYTMKDNGDGTYTLEDLTINGQPLDDNAVYNVLLLGDDDYIFNSIYCNCPMPEELQARRLEINVDTYNSYDCFLDAVKECGQLETPTEYVTIQR